MHRAKSCSSPGRSRRKRTNTGWPGSRTRRAENAGEGSGTLNCCSRRTWPSSTDPSSSRQDCIGTSRQVDIAAVRTDYAVLLAVHAYAARLADFRTFPCDPDLLPEKKALLNREHFFHDRNDGGVAFLAG